MKIACVRTGGGGGGPDPYARTAYRGGIKNWQIFAYVLYGWPLIQYHDSPRILLFCVLCKHLRNTSLWVHHYRSNLTNIYVIVKLK